MTVTEALQLVNSGAVPFTHNSFMTCHSWHFEHEGRTYRLCEWEGTGVYVEEHKLPRRKLDYILFVDEDHPHAKAFIHG